MPAWRGDEAGGHHDRRLAAWFQRIDDVLEEELVDGHLVLGLLGDVRHPGEEAFLMVLGVQLVAEIAEIHLEGRIGDDVVELLQRLAVPVVGVEHGVALDDVGDGVHQVVEDQVQAQQAGGFLRDVLRIDAAALLADGVGDDSSAGCRNRLTGS